MACASLVALAGCGPVGIALGFNEAFDDAVAAADTVFPEVFIDDAPALQSSSDSADFTFRVNKETITLTGSLDGGVSFPIRGGILRLDGLAEGDHTLRVVATDAQNRVQEVVFTWRVDFQAPPFPAGVRVLAVTPTTLALAWNESADEATGIDHYNVHYGTGDSVPPLRGTGAIIGTVTRASPAAVGNVTVVTLSNLPSCRLHSLAVSVVDGAGNESALSPIVAQRTPCGADGAFAPALLTPAGAGPVSLAAADFDADGIPDLAVGDATAGSIRFLRGVGDGTFTAGAIVPVAGTIDRIFAADFDLDGILDVAATDGAVLFGQATAGRANGTFVAVDPATRGTRLLGVGRFRTRAGNAPFSALPDGFPDLLVESISIGSTLEPHFSRGDRSFDGGFEFETGFFIDALAFPGRATVADFDDDGFSDFVVTLTLQSRFVLGLGDADLGLVNAGAFATTDTPGSIGVLDLDGNGVLDLAVANRRAAGTLEVFAGTESAPGPLGFRSVQILAVGDTPTDTVCGDFNSDAIPDVAVSCAGSHDVRVFLGEGAGGVGTGMLRAGAPFAVGPAGEHGPTDLAVADFDRDGILDLATANPLSGTVSVLLGRGAVGAGEGLFAQTLTIPTSEFGVDLAAADFDADGVLDLAVVGNDAPPGVFNAAPTVVVYAGNGQDGRGDGTFAAGLPISLPLRVGDLPQRQPASSLAVTDLNGDHVLDMIVSRIGPGNQFAALLTGQGADGRGNGLFTSNTAFGRRARFFVAGRFFDDPRPDVLAVDDVNDDSEITAVDLDGSGFLISAENVATTPGFASAGVVADLDRNGFDDIVIVTPVPGRIDVYLRDVGGADRFSEGDAFTAGAQPTGVAVADVNHDGAPDLVVANRADSTVSVLLAQRDAAGHPTGRFTKTAQDVAVGGEPVFVTAVDVDRDGLPDVVTANATGSISVLLGARSAAIDTALLQAPAVRDYVVAEDPVKVVTGDFDGDGIPDLCVLSRTAKVLTILLGVNVEE